MSCFAAIDLGTNTARLFIGSLAGDGQLQPLVVRREIVRLGGGFTESAGISAEAWQRALGALVAFAADLRQYPVIRVRAVATSAVRDAMNGPAFCAAVAQETGINLEVIDGHEEGMLTLRGVRAGIVSTSDNLLVFDVGGGSTEYTIAAGARPVFTESLPLGVVRLTEGRGSCPAMAEKIDRELAGLWQRMQALQVQTYLARAELVGTAGTATTLAAISLGMVEYDYRQVNNYVVPRAEIQAIFDRLLPLSPQERLQVHGLERGREDLIIAGTLLTLHTMDRFGFDHLKVSDFGLLEGVFLSISHQGPAKVLM